MFLFPSLKSINMSLEENFLTINKNLERKKRRERREGGRNTERKSILNGWVLKGEKGYKETAYPHLLATLAITSTPASGHVTPLSESLPPHALKSCRKL